MLREEFIRRKVELIHQELGRLEEFADLTFDKLATDWKSHSIVENLLLKIIGRAIDINQHIISELASIKVAAPLGYKETFLKLAELKVLPRKFAESIAESSGFRNILVHEYNNIDERIFYRSVGEALEQYTKYCNYLLKFIEK